MKNMLLPQAENDTLFTFIGSPVSLIAAICLIAASLLILLFFKRR